MAIVVDKATRRVKKKEPREISYVTKVGYTINRRVGERKAPFTTPELINQQGTGIITQFLRPVMPVIRVGFQNIPEGKYWTAYNHASSVLKLSAIKGEYPNKEIDYEKVKFSVGNLAKPQQVKLSLDGDHLNFTWMADLEAEGADNNDRVMIVAYFPDTCQSLYIINGARRTEEFETMPLPQFTTSTRIETYISFVNRNSTNVSDSVYVGQIMAGTSAEETKIEDNASTEEQVGMVKNTSLPTIKTQGKRTKKGRNKKKKEISEQNLRVKLISEAHRMLNPAIKIGYQADRQKGTAYSRATKYNLKNAIKGQYPDLEIDYSKLRISHGSREGIWGAKLTFETDSWVRLDWQIPELCDTKAIGNDRAVIAVYQPKSFLLYGINLDRFNSVRSALTHRVRLKASGLEQDDDGFVHIWMFFISPDGKQTSNSHYFGSGYINEQRD